MKIEIHFSFPNFLLLLVQVKENNFFSDTFHQQPSTISIRNHKSLTKLLIRLRKLNYEIGIKFERKSLHACYTSEFI